VAHIFLESRLLVISFLYWLIALLCIIGLHFFPFYIARRRRISRVWGGERKGFGSFLAAAEGVDLTRWRRRHLYYKNEEDLKMIQKIQITYHTIVLCAVLAPALSR